MTFCDAAANIFPVDSFLTTGITLLEGDNESYSLSKTRTSAGASNSEVHRFLSMKKTFKVVVTLTFNHDEFDQ